MHKGFSCSHLNMRGCIWKSVIDEGVYVFFTQKCMKWTSKNNMENNMPSEICNRKYFSAIEAGQSAGNLRTFYGSEVRPWMGLEIRALRGIFLGTSGLYISNLWEVPLISAQSGCQFFASLGVIVKVTMANSRVKQISYSNVETLTSYNQVY